MQRLTSPRPTRESVFYLMRRSSASGPMIVFVWRRTHPDRHGPVWTQPVQNMSCPSTFLRNSESTRYRNLCQASGFHRLSSKPFTKYSRSLRSPCNVVGCGSFITVTAHLLYLLVVEKCTVDSIIVQEMRFAVQYCWWILEKEAPSGACCDHCSRPMVTRV